MLNEQILPYSRSLLNTDNLTYLIGYTDKMGTNKAIQNAKLESHFYHPCIVTQYCNQRDNVSCELTLAHYARNDKQLRARSFGILFEQIVNIASWPTNTPFCYYSDQKLTNIELLHPNECNDQLN